MAVSASAQLPHSYYCDFENAEENAAWKLNTPKNENYSWLNQWAIGGAVSSLGKQSMYSSPDGGTNVGYLKDQSRIMIAWRELTMEAGRYDLAFDWMCGGDSARAALLVGWVPQSGFADMACALNDDYKAKKWIKDNMRQFDRSELLTRRLGMDACSRYVGLGRHAPQTRIHVRLQFCGAVDTARTLCGQYPVMPQ